VRDSVWLTWSWWIKGQKGSDKVDVEVGDCEDERSGWADRKGGGSVWMTVRQKSRGVECHV
jgi:hypothetical protein